MNALILCQSRFLNFFHIFSSTFMFTQNFCSIFPQLCPTFFSNFFIFAAFFQLPFNSNYWYLMQSGFVHWVTQFSKLTPKPRRVLRLPYILIPLDKFGIKDVSTIIQRLILAFLHFWQFLCLIELIVQFLVNFFIKSENFFKFFQIFYQIISQLCFPRIWHRQALFSFCLMNLISSAKGTGRPYFRKKHNLYFHMHFSHFLIPVSNRSC
jgi:hypothetical protein